MRPHAASSAYADRVVAWLASMDPLTFAEADIERARDELVGLRAEGEALRSDLAASGSGRAADRRVLDALDTLLAALPDPAPPADRLAWLDAREAVSPLYEAYARALLSRGVRARHLHPTNFKRSAVHLASGLAVVAAFLFVFTPTTGFWTASAFVVWAWSLEGARRMSARVNAWCMVVFGPIARDHERYRVNSATWYGTAVWVLAVTAYGPAGVLALLALAVGDPVAGIVGRKYGQIRMFGGKSLEGSLAFALSSAVAGYAYLLAFEPALAPPAVLLALAVLAGITGAVVELLSTRLEDNFTIPVLTAWAVQLALWLAV